MQFVRKLTDDVYTVESEAEMSTNVIGGIIFFAVLVGFVQFVYWAAGEDLGLAEAAFGPLEKPAAVAYSSSARSWSGSCRVRSGPGTEFSIIGSTRPTKTYAVLETDGGWKRIGPRGWVGCR